jgi:hypothetical protein
MKKIFGLLALLVTGGFSATSALYLHHERSSQATVEADCQNREVCLDKINLAPIGRFNDGTLWHGVTQEKPNVNLTGTLTVTGATVLSNNLTLSLFATGRIPYTTTAGLLTSGTGLTYNGSAFSVTGTGAFSGAVSGPRINLNGATDNASYGLNLLTSSIGITRTGGVGGRSYYFGLGYPGSAINEYLTIMHDGVNGAVISSEANGGTVRPILIQTGGVTAITVSTTQGVQLASTLGVTGVTTATGGLVLGASFVDKTTSLTSNTTLTSAHSTIFASASGGSFTITLPAAAGLGGLTYTIYKTDVTAAATGGGNTVTIDGDASETIGGDLTQVLASNTGNGTLKIICDGSNWRIQELLDEGTFTGTLTGCTTSPTGTISYSRNGKKVAMYLPQFLATSNTSNSTITGVPSSLNSSFTTAYVSIPEVRDNSTQYLGELSMPTAGTIGLFFFTTSWTNSFTSSGQKGLLKCFFTYLL